MRKLKSNTVKDKNLFCAAAGLSQVVRGRQASAQRPCAGSQGRLRGSRAVASLPCAYLCSIPAA
jgi:hypothetical protein